MSPTPLPLALVPARAGSQRLVGKNTRLLAGHPLIAYSIAAARRAGVFGRVVVSTDSEEIAATALEYGAEVPWLRPAALAGPLSRDIEWLEHALEALSAHDEQIVALLRPTSPLRREESIAAAVAELMADPRADSLRAVEPVRQHPGKMWILEDAGRMRPLLEQPVGEQPWHSSPYQSLPLVHVQNAALEVAWVRTVRRTGTIAGDKIRPFVLPGEEGRDLNDEADWWVLERLVEVHPELLPSPLPADDPGGPHS